MEVTYIPVEADVLARLLKLRQDRLESYSDLLRRVLPRHRDAAVAVTAPARGHENGTLPLPDSGRGIGYMLLGNWHTARDANTAMIEILVRLGGMCPDLLDRLAPMVRGRTRNHIARSPEMVYPDRPDLLEHVRPLVPGWYIGCNIADREKVQFLKFACKLAGLTYGRDLKVSFDGVRRRRRRARDRVSARALSALAIPAQVAS
jgi:predicted CopG family antitoxin